MAEGLTRHPDVEMIIAVLTARRYQLGISQEEVANRIGSSQSAISDIETGVNRNPQSSTLARMAVAMGLRLTIRPDVQALDVDGLGEAAKLLMDLHRRGIVEASEVHL